MKKRTFKAVSAFMVFTLAFLMLTGMPTMAGDGLTDATVQSYEDQLASYKQKQEQALQELEAIRESQSEAWMEIGKYDELLNYNMEMKNLASGQLDSLAVQIEEKKQSIEDTAAAIETQEQAFLDRMVATYMEEEADYIELLLGSEDIVDFLTKMERVNAILEYDRRIVDNLSENKVTLEAEKEALDYAEEIQKQRVADYEAAIAQNQQIYDAKLEYLNSLVSDENSLVNEYSYYKQLEDEKNAELENYLAELAEQQRQIQVSYVGGSLWWPLESGVYYQISSYFGWRDLYGMQDFHRGVDLACANGTTVYAANSGTVLNSEYHYSYGNYVLIDHGGGISTLYAHMSSCAVTAGETVAAGQTIGWVGLTGNTSGYHLHFEVRENGTIVDPCSYLVFP
ncbi:MAG: murein hydrolase activator EnvC family protein [Eubacteriales bacterium]